MHDPLTRVVWFALTVAPALWACGNEYVCPDPIGTIVRDDCEVYRTRYESLKVELSFSVGKWGVSAAAGKEKLRDPSELLQLLMQQTLALCKDFNACRVLSQDYRRRREESDRKFTAITAINQQLKSDLDAASKRELVSKLLEILTGPSPEMARPGGRQRRPSRRPAKRCTHFLPRSTSIYFGSRLAPPRPKGPPGVPSLASWEMTHARGVGRATTHVHLTLWGETQADDYVYVTLGDSGLIQKARVKGRRGRPEARASVRFEKRRLPPRGVMTLSYRVGATLKKHPLGRVKLDPRHWRGQAFVAYLPDPLRGCPVEYERPHLVFFTQVRRKTRATVRCTHEGRPVKGVLTGTATGGTYQAGRLRRHHVPLPVRIPLKGGTARGSWRARFPGEEVPVDQLPGEAAGDWECRVSLDGRLARKMAFRLQPDGAVVPARRPTALAPPWWPVKVSVVAVSLKKRRDQELAEEEAKAKARQLRFQR
jgi:hypothetical protein